MRKVGLAPANLLANATVEQEQAEALARGLQRAGMGKSDTEHNPIHFGEDRVGDPGALGRFLEILGGFSMAYPHLFCHGGADITSPRLETPPGGFLEYVGV